MRVETTVMSVSWIPSEAIGGSTKLPFEMGVTHYDDPPPDRIDDIDALHRDGAFRFANVLHAWAEIDDGRIIEVGQDGRGLMSSTLVKVGAREIAFQPTPFPDLVTEPQWDPRTARLARFVRTAGGRPGVPAPRRVSHPPFIQLKGPSVWSTIGVTINADGTTAFELVGASPFPRHWIYVDGALTAKAGLIDFDEWYAHAFGKHTPWGEEDSPAMVATVESALERQLALTIMRGGAKPTLRKLKKGERLVEQGEAGAELFLVLDGMLDVTVDGEEIAELGPGAILGERASLEKGVRTATLTAITPVRVAVAAATDIDLDALARLAEDHRREDDR